MSLDAFRERLADAAVLLDFDGSLAPIVSRPEDARPLPDVPDVLRELIPRVKLVAIVTGRPSSTIRALLGPIEGLRIAGLYGFEGAPALGADVLGDVRDALGGRAGVQVETKGPSVAVHYRNAPDPDGAAEALRARLSPIASRHGLRLLDGKRVWELAPAGAGGKGEAVDAIVAEIEPSAVLYAGDDIADLEAFAALDRVAGSVLVRKVAVLGDEAPVALREAADVIVEGPAGLLELLRGL